MNFSQNFQADELDHALPVRHFKYNRDCGQSGLYINYREISGRFELEPGHYVIIPSTYNIDDESTFMLRVFGEKPFKLKG